MQKFYKIEELTKKKVVIIKNLKPAKLAGMLSEAMILAGSVPTEDGGEIVKVRINLKYLKLIIFQIN